MLNFKLTLLCCVLSIFSSLAQTDSLGMEQLFNYDDNTLPASSRGVIYNDCWGYTDAAGREYAIMGGAENIFFFDITDPENTSLIRKVNDNDPDIPGNVDLDPTTWRDFKTYGTKAYACADEGNEGLTVFDLSLLPDTVTVDTQFNNIFTRAHNIFIDTARGYLYTAGARLGSTFHDVIIFDLKTEPISLIADVSVDGGYIHDIHVVNDTAYCNSAVSEFFIIDFTDPVNPSTIGFLDDYTGSGYNHSGWLTDDGDHYVFCDETVGRKVKILDVSDPENISNAEITDQFFSNLLDETATNPSSLAHNPFIIGDLVYIAYYDDGVQVFDISDPNNVVRKAYYDTNNNSTYVHDGVWGVYPFFESGSIIASDIENGLFVLRMMEEALPADLLSFDVSKAKDRVQLNWATASEENTKAFEIERSSDGENFYPLKSIAASNNSVVRIDYETYDDAPLSGENYYRLKQIDLNDKFQYSPIKSVFFAEKALVLNPSLVSSESTVKLYLNQLAADLSVEVINVSGQLVKTHHFGTTNDNLVEIPVHDLQNGLYVFRIRYNQSFTTEKVMIAR